MVKKYDKNRINIILDIVLLLLFMSSIALICMKFNVINRIKTTFSPVNLSIDGKILRKYITPNQITLRFSKDSATILHGYNIDYSESFSSTMREAFLDNVEIVTINKKAYQSALNQKSITFEYGNIPSKALEKSIGLTDTSLASLKNIREITFITEEKNNSTMYIVTSKDIIKIEKDLKNKFPEMQNIENSKFISYYPVFDNSQNMSNILVPLNPIFDIKDIEINSIIENTGIDSLSKAIFDERLDFTSFTRRDDGSYFYSYKNGQEIMSISPDSLLEYKNNDLKFKKNISSYDAILLTTDFLNKIGLSGQISIYSIEETEQMGSQVIDIKLKRNINLSPLLLLTSEGIENIKIINGIISDCKIFMYKFSYENTGKSIAPLNPLDCLNESSNIISEILEIENVTSLTNLITDINMIYYLNKYKENIPAWQYKIKEKEFILDANTGEIVNGSN